MQVFIGNIQAAVSIMAKPWAEGHVARISSAKVCGQMIPNDLMTTGK